MSPGSSRCSPSIGSSRLRRGRHRAQRRCRRSRRRRRQFGETFVQGRRHPSDACLCERSAGLSRRSETWPRRQPWPCRNIPARHFRRSLPRHPIRWRRNRDRLSSNCRPITSTAGFGRALSRKCISISSRKRMSCAFRRRPCSSGRAAWKWPCSRPTAGSSLARVELGRDLGNEVEVLSGLSPMPPSSIARRSL